MDKDGLAEQFEANREHLRGVAYRILGSLTEADDAVQETWLRLSRADTSAVEDLRRWLTTVTARVCLDMLRARKSRREDPLFEEPPEPIVARDEGAAPEPEIVMADSVGLALLVVLETLAPAERLAFVLHDMFAMPFEEIAPIVGRTPTAARQLASRARRRVQGGAASSGSDRARQREVVSAFLAASRSGDFDALLAVLDPDVVVRADPSLLQPGEPVEVRGARAVASQALLFRQRAAFTRMVLINGEVGAAVAPRGSLAQILRFTITGSKISTIDVIADPARLRQLDLAVLPGADSR